MKALIASLGHDWCDMQPPPADDDKGKKEFQTRSEAVKRHVTEIMLAENLVVLTGLGTSLCLKDASGKKLAPTMNDLWKALADRMGEKFTTVKKLVGYKTPPSGENIELLLSRCLLSERLQPNPEVAALVAIAEQIILEKCRLPDKDTTVPHHEAFLRRVARRSTRLPRMRLFTTNYDLCFETAASKARFVVIDGFSHTQPQEFDGGYFGYDLVRRHPDKDVPDYIANVFHLYKLHGSMDWELVEDQIVKSVAPSRPLIVYPRDSKFESSYDQPFLEMMSRFQMAIRQPNTGFLIVGFGFNDNHIAQPILAAIRSNVGLKCLIVDPSLEGTANPHLQGVIDLVTAGDSRLALLTQTFEGLVPLLPDLVAATEEEQHRARVTKVGART